MSDDLIAAVISLDGGIDVRIHSTFQAQPVGYEVLDNGCLCFIMPAEVDMTGAKWVFEPKVWIVDDNDQ